MRHYIYTPRSGSKIIGKIGLCGGTRMAVDLQNGSHLLLGDYVEISWGSGSRDWRGVAGEAAAQVASDLGGVATDVRGEISLYVPRSAVPKAVAYGNVMGAQMEYSLRALASAGILKPCLSDPQFGVVEGGILTSWRFASFPAPTPIEYCRHENILAWRFEGEFSWRMERGVSCTLGGVPLEPTPELIEEMNLWARAHREFESNKRDLVADMWREMGDESSPRDVHRAAWKRCLEDLCTCPPLDLDHIEWPLSKEQAIEALVAVGACRDGAVGAIYESFEGKDIGRSEVEEWFAHTSTPPEHREWARKALRTLMRPNW